jgi:hypothetical protein
MFTIRTLRSRIVRRLALLSAVVAGLLVPAQTAFARIDPAGHDLGAGRPATPVVVTQAGSSSGLAIWIVAIVGVAAIAVGFGLSELIRARLGNRSVRRPATA